MVDDVEVGVDRRGEGVGTHPLGVGQMSIEMEADAARIDDDHAGCPVDQRRYHRAVAAVRPRRRAAGVTIDEGTAILVAPAHPQADVAGQVGLADEHVQFVAEVGQTMISEHRAHLLRAD